MCGITGFISNEQFDSFKDDLPEAVSALSHRGPDDLGIWYDKESGVGLGHRRLSILDLSSIGRQPMVCDDGSVRVVFNGEVYNFKKIRKVLIGLGHRFKSGTDTEVVLKSYIQWGVDCLQYFVGMFSMAIWDGKRNKLFLARDRIGIKPLYYYKAGNALIFASELKSIMSFKGFNKELDRDSLSLYLNFMFIPGPSTIFRNTSKLLPGHYAIFDGETFKINSYWKAKDKYKGENELLQENEYIHELEQLLKISVSDRLISDVPLGALLSGGIDSSLIVAIMQEVSNTQVKTFSIGFSEEKYNEAHWAFEIAKYLGTDHTEYYVTPKDALEVIPKLPYIYDEPFGDSSAIPTYLVSDITRSAVTVALSGDCGDEVFAVYQRYMRTVNKEYILRNIPDSIRGDIAKLMKITPLDFIEKLNHPIKKLFPYLLETGTFRDKWKTLNNLLQSKSSEETYRMAVTVWPKYDIINLINRDVPISRYEESFIGMETLPLLSRLMMVDLSTILPDDYLTKVDRSSMAVGLEVRVPILDHRVVEFATNMPNYLKYNNGNSKYILKKILNKYLPRKLFERSKRGFGVPIDSWFRGELKTILTDYLSAEHLKKEGLFNTGYVDKILKEHLQGSANHTRRLWGLLMWQMWREQWMNGH